MFLKNFNSVFCSIILVSIMSCGNDKKSQFELPSLFSDGMVLQRDTLVSVTGKYFPNQKIDISCSWGFDTTTFSDANGNWKIHLKTNSAIKAQTMILSSENDIHKINDILLGEVWIAAGQSNMEMTFDYCCNSTDSSDSEIKSAYYPKIRMYNVKKTLSVKPLESTEGEWVSAVGNNISNFSAVGYFFAKKLHKDLDIPIGIIHASWGGSGLQSWTNKNVLKNFDGYTQKLKNIEQDSLKYKKTKQWYEGFENIQSGSGAWDLYLSSDILPDTIEYFNFVGPKWKKLDDLGKRDIVNYSQVSKYWNELDDENIVRHLMNNPNFSGALLFKNKFNIDSISSIEYNIIIGPNEGAPFKLWEYDIYINGEKQGSSLIDIKDNKYSFIKELQSYKIDPKALKIGENSIFIRILGYASLGDIKIKTSNDELIPFLKDWRVKLLAEETSQINNYNYPYTAFYNYENIEVNYNDIPEKYFLNHNMPSILYNGMLHPLLNYTVKGIIWYQGENNVNDPAEYKAIFTEMVKDLRTSFGSQIPFYFAQIANYFNYGGKLSSFRQMQLDLLQIINTGMVVTLDIGENYDIHPSNKHDVGNRFALLALNRTYGLKIVDSGPVLNELGFDGKYVNLYFKNTGAGLKITDYGKPCFEIAGEDKKYFESDVNVYKNFLQLSSNYVQNPKFVRYAWSDTAKATLFNIEGLPASPFSSEYMEDINR